MVPLPLALLLGSGCSSEPAAPPVPAEAPEPPVWSCEPRAWHADADADGYGDPSRRVDACLAPAGHVADATDCDDLDATTHPGAADVCDAVLDNDCDGTTDPSEADDDGDGLTECAGDCDDERAEVHPDGVEVCDGLDDDCNGLADLDDPDVDLYTCGYCPDPALLLGTTAERSSLNPCVLDPTVSMCREPPDVDTHELGNRLHRITWRNDGHPLREELLIFLPPGPGSHNQSIMGWAAYAGYRAINLGWMNEVPFGAATTPYGEDLFQEVVYGLDTQDQIDIAPNDAIMGRLDTLMAYLVATDPASAWDRYWDPVGGMHWDEVVLIGWSDGGTAAAFIARDHEVDGLILVSSPKDSDWVADPRATPACKTFAFFHREEPLAAEEPFTISFQPMGMVGPEVDTDSSLPPYGGAQIFSTELEDFVTRDCTYHKAMATDGCMHEAQIIPYMHLYCTAADVDTCPP